MRVWLLLALFAGTNAWATARIEPTISCQTRSGLPGGFHIRLDVARNKNGLTGEFSQILPARGDVLRLAELGKEEFAVTVGRGSTGHCVLKLKQTSDVDRNNMDFRIRIAREAGAESPGVLKMQLDGRALAPDKGDLTCTVSNHYLRFYLTNRCDSPFATQINFPDDPS